MIQMPGKKNWVTRIKKAFFDVHYLSQLLNRIPHCDKLGLTRITNQRVKPGTAGSLAVHCQLTHVILADNRSQIPIR
jgi:hypothetical protein